MATHLNDLHFDSKRYPLTGSVPYLNPNIWLSDGTDSDTIDPADPASRKHPGWEVDNPELRKGYWLNALITNNGQRGASGVLWILFFLTPPSATPNINDPNTIPLGIAQQGNHSYLDALPTNPAPGTDLSTYDNYFKSAGKSPVITGGTGDRCLVAVIGWLPEYASNLFIDDQWKPRMNAPLVDIGNLNMRYVAQHNLTVVNPLTGGGSLNGITHLGSLTLYGIAEGESASLVARAPSEAEAAHLRDQLKPLVRGTRDVTASTLVGLFSSKPDSDGKEQLEKAPLRSPIEGLEPRCAREVYLGMRFPEDTTDDAGDGRRKAAFMLIEQLNADGKLMGGIVVLALGEEVDC